MAERIIVKGRKGKDGHLENLKLREQPDVNECVLEEIPTSMRAEALRNDSHTSFTKIEHCHGNLDPCEPTGRHWKVHGRSRS